MLSNSPQLWVVATPLGNPGDLSPRAKEVLESVDTVLAEDTRRAGLLCQRCGVQARRFASYHNHNEEARLPELLERLHAGEHMALISDAGLPLMADPGYRLVKACREQDVRVSVVPGPSAPVTALAGSGIAPQPFVFFGFLPRSRGDISKSLSPFINLPLTLVFFERKDRLNATLALAAELLGPREVCVARELTKTHEEYIRLNLADAANLAPLLGEITVIIGPPLGTSRSAEAEVLAQIAQAAPDGDSPRALAKRVNKLVQGWNTQQVYALISRTRDEK